MLWMRFTTWAKKIEASYKKMGYPFRPVTGLIREPMRWFYHLSPHLRYDNKFYLKPFILNVFHHMLVVIIPQDFRIYHNKIAFRSYGSLMSIQAYYVGEVEYHLVRYVVSQMKPGFVMLDIGAHHGLYTLIIACELMLHSWKGIIHSFEPNPFNFSLLRYNVKRNKFSGFVRLYNKAVSNINNQQTLIFSPEENSDSQLESVQDINEAGFQNNTGILKKKVHVIKLDSLLKNIQRVDLIKMDVQGAEALALAGGEKLIMRDKPIFVIEAVRGWPTTDKIKKFLIRQGYTLHGINKNSSLCPIDSPDVYVTWDLIGIPPKKA